MAARSRLTPTLFSALFLVSGAISIASPQDVAAQKERARGLITELFSLRLDLQLRDLEEGLGLEQGALDEARAQGRDAVVGWIEEHPVKLRNQGSIAWTATPIEHAPFSEFALSEPWAAVSDSVLTAIQREELDARTRAREERAVAALAALMDWRLARAFYLAGAERKALAPVCDAAARKLWEQGVVEEFRGPYGGMPRSEDRFRAVIDEPALLAALSESRRPIVADLLKEGRTSIHDLRLQAEFHLCGVEDAGDKRRLLYGLVDALVHRDGKKPRESRWPFDRIRGAMGKGDWQAGVSGVLGLGGETPDIPEHKELGERLRARFLVAVLDERASFTDEQRESLMPLMVAYVEEEKLSRRSGPAMELLMPKVLGLSQDGLLVPGENDRLNNASTKVRSLVKTLYEACSEEQRDVLRS